VYKITDKVKNNIDEYITFLHNYDARKDQYIANNPHLFSHRLHWDEHPFCYEIRKKYDISSLENIEKILQTCLVFSFSNEHYQTFINFMDYGDEYFKTTNSFCRNDLYEIFLPKGMRISEGLIECQYNYKNLAKRIYKRYKTRKYTIMELARILDENYKKRGHVRWGYMAKNASRYFAMAYPDIVDPNSQVTGGPGHYRGLAYIFDYPYIAQGIKITARLENGNLIPDRDNLIGDWFCMMGYLQSETKDIFKRHNWLNNEDKVCFFNKYINFKTGNRKQNRTKINMRNIIGDNFIL
jgi:hypothetical protein